MSNGGGKGILSRAGELLLAREKWERPGEPWRGRVEGHHFGTGVSVIFYATEEVGAGPRLHVHDYDEIFIVREGHARFTVGEREIEARSGDVVFGPAGIPHRFWNLGPGRLETVDIHLVPEIRQTNLD